MPKKIKKHLNLKSKWLIAIAFTAFMGSLLLSLKSKPESIRIPEPTVTRQAAEVLALSQMPALTSDIHLYNQYNEILAESGSVTIRHPDGLEEQITTQSIVNAGDEISVGSNSNAEVLWFDGSVTRLAEGTEIKILEASYDEKNVSKTAIRLFAERGKIWAKVVDLIDGESEFLIESTSAIAGVRGTTFNYILEHRFPAVEVIDHTVFIQSNLPQAIPVSLTGGQTGTFSRAGAVEIKSFDTNKLNETYYAKNLEKDLLAGARLKEDNLEKIKKLAGPLPGDPDYGKKQQLIEDLLTQTKDPSKLSELEARIEKIKVYEAITMSDSEAMKNALGEFEKKTEDPELPVDRRDAIRNHLKNNLKNIERALTPVQEGDADLYEIKTIIRDEHVEMEADPEKQKKSREKADFRQSFEQETPPPKIIPDAGLKQTAEEQDVKQAAPKRIIYPKRTYYPVKTVDPKVKHEEVLKKINTSRENHQKRVEERLKREQELQEQQPEQQPEQDSEEVKRKGKSQPDEIDKTQPKKDDGKGVETAPGQQKKDEEPSKPRRKKREIEKEPGYTDEPGYMK